MPVRPTAPAGAPCWIDLQTSDVDAARAFYTGLFGWTAGDPSPEFGGYFMFLRDGMPVAGAMRSDDQAPVSDVWSVYLSVPDAAKTLETAAAHGGQVLVHPMPVADLGTMGFLVDPAGAAVGVWQPGSFPGFVTLGETAAPAWFEVYTRDYAATLDFYRDVLGWRLQTMGDTDEFRYSVMLGDTEAEQWAGVMDGTGFLPEGVPAHWATYFQVEDADAAVARVTDLGGGLHEGPWDTPYGRMAIVTDATGAMFRVIQPPAG
jgi:predicted enzyme related to lactoylglutathione lyase